MLNVKKCIKTCVTKYGLSEMEAERIATTDNIFLSIEDLRFKYDNMYIGTGYPEWLTPEVHLKMCYATVWRRYSKKYFWFNSVDDVAYELFVYSSIHMHKYKDINQLNGLLLCRLKNIIRDYERSKTCVYDNRYDWEYKQDDGGTNYKFAYKYNKVLENNMNTAELVLTVNSIKNDKIKGILLLCGYFMANIQEFLKPLVQYYNGSSELVKAKIYELGKDDIYFCKSINADVVNTVEVHVTLGKILKVFGKRSKSYIQDELLPYLNGIGIVNIQEVI